MTRGFEIVDEKFIKVPDIETELPLHGSQNSAGYDIRSKEEVELYPGEKHKFNTDIKAYMLSNEFLAIVVRSSIGMVKGLRITNQFGVIDSDYYDNEDTGGNISVELQNTTQFPVKINIGDRIAQGIFMNWLKADEGTFEKKEKYKRTGGIGHTGE